MAVDKRWDDRTTETVIGNLLRAGVALAAVVVSCGAVLFLRKYRNLRADYRVFHGETAQYSTLAGIFHEAFALHGRGIIQLGLVLLIATPVARVAFSIWAFEKEKDRMYVVFTTIVLAVLLYSFFGPGI
jgi:uncharacterized membrane protein